MVEILRVIFLFFCDWLKSAVWEVDLNPINQTDEHCNATDILIVLGVPDVNEQKSYFYTQWTVTFIKYCNFGYVWMNLEISALPNAFVLLRHDLQ